MGAAGLFDVQQVEILKGPQGGLYGRNTSGGAVLMNTRRAQQNVTNAYLQAGYGSWDRARITGGDECTDQSGNGIAFVHERREWQ